MTSAAFKASPIVSLLLDVGDPGTLGVDVHDPNRAVRRISGRTSRVVNLKQANTIALMMSVSCSAAQVGHDLPIGLQPTVRGEPIGSYEVIVRCRS